MPAEMYIDARAKLSRFLYDNPSLSPSMDGRIPERIDMFSRRSLRRIAEHFGISPVGAYKADIVRNIERFMEANHG